MTGKELLHQLVRGSAEIDRMRKAINSIVPMLLGLITTKALQQTFESRGFRKEWFKRSNNREWMLWVPDLQSDPVVECWGWSSGGQYLLYSNRANPLTSIDIKLEHVQLVYEGLPEFIDGLIETFPHLLIYARLLINAAKIKETDYLG